MENIFLITITRGSTLLKCSFRLCGTQFIMIYACTAGSTAEGICLLNLRNNFGKAVILHIRIDIFLAITSIISDFTVSKCSNISTLSTLFVVLE